MYGNTLTVLSIINGIFIIINSCFECHDDPVFEPEEGPLTELQFSWLGALQYIHVKEGTPHYFRVPRVVLVSRQFGLSLAKDAAEIPAGYALGNVVFNDYERDEAECKVTKEEMAEGGLCDPTVLIMPVADVLLHPEYKHFGIKTSVALLKLLTPIKSRYMLPACLPLKDFLKDDNGKQIYGYAYHVDFVSEVPRDFMEEEKEVIFLYRIGTYKCFVGPREKNNSTLPLNRYLCTDGCDLQSGSPTVVHEHMGHWNVLALAEGGSPCPDPLRSRGPGIPARHLLVQPYVPWITNAISGRSVGSNTKDDPFGYIVPRASTGLSPAAGWVGRWWLGGVSCYDRGEAARNVYRFYHEIFDLYPDLTYITQLIYYLEGGGTSPGEQGRKSAAKAVRKILCSTISKNLLLPAIPNLICYTFLILRCLLLYLALKPYIYNLFQINAGHNLFIVCVKVGMPYQMANPMIWGLNTVEVKLRIPILMIKKKYRIIVEAWTNNGSAVSGGGEEISEEGDFEDSDEYGEAQEVEYVGYDEELGKMGKQRIPGQFRETFPETHPSGRFKPPDWR